MNFDKCLRPNCPYVKRRRGLCRKCYKVAEDLVRKKKTSWIKLIEAGKMLNYEEFTIEDWLLDKEPR